MLKQKAESVMKPDSKVAPNYSLLLVSMPLCMELPLSMGRTYDFLPANRRKQW